MNAGAAGSVRPLATAGRRGALAGAAGRRGALAGAAGLLATLAGCATTQQEAARLQLNSSRIRASQLAVRVTRPGEAVKIVSTTILRGSRGEAIVVRLRNTTTRPTSDLPISVGIRAAGHRRRYLNGAAGADYFDAHVSSIAAGGELSWVLTTHRHLPRSAHVFAIVSGQSTVPVPAIHALPRIELSDAGSTAATLRVIVRNRTPVPQYQLPIYAVVTHAGRMIAAGRASVEHLGTQTQATVRIRLLGRFAAGSAPTLEAPPTIFN